MGGRIGGVLLVVAALAATAVPAGASQEQPRTSNTELVGHADPGDGPYADVWAYKDVAYLGSYRSARCATAPNGVWAVDVRDPAKPRLLGQFGVFRGSDDEDVWVGTVRTRAFSGDLAAVGIQPCERRPSFAGLALYDVSDPSRPKELGRLATGVARGVHELGVAQRADGRLLALAAVPGSFPLSNGAKGDLRVVDISDPRHPTELADWDVRRDGPAPLRAQLGAREDVFDHSAWPFAHGTKLFASWWAAGVVFLDISDPSRPRWIGRTSYKQGDRVQAAHSGWFNRDETLFVQNDETLGVNPKTPGETWTYQRIWDTRDLAHPMLVSSFATEAAAPGADARIGTDGIYSVHNAVIDGNLEYASWYSDGVRVVDLADPAHPREVGYFVPPATGTAPDGVSAPGGGRTFPLVWGVYRANGLVFASEMGSGLWIFRYRPASGGSAPPGSNALQQPAARRAPSGSDSGGLPPAAAVALGAGVLAALGGGAAALRARRSRQATPGGE
ncbi:MAG TPA: hypothetical protein VF486_07740 [Actinomycetes bacterium]